MSLQQIDTAVRKIWDNADSYARQGFVVDSIVTVGLEDTGFEVAGTYSSRLAAQTGRDVPTSVQADRQAVADSMEASTGARLTLREGSVAWTVGRSNDSSPFYAGGYMKSGSNTCSVGFGLKINGQTYTSTANHCRGTWTARDNSGISYGPTYMQGSMGGGLLLNSRSSGRMWDGAWNNTTFMKSVSGFRDVSLNDVICTSGGNSGVHCNIKINNMKISVKDAQGLILDVIQGQQTVSGQIAVVAGDSGGPVLFPNSDGVSVGAVGLIQGIPPGQTSPVCGPAHDPTTLCSATVMFSSMRTIAGYVNATLVTG